MLPHIHACINRPFSTSPVFEFHSNVFSVQVWQLSARGGKHLNQEQFNRALHLIYLAQQKLPITIETEKELLAQNRQMIPFIQYKA